MRPLTRTIIATLLFTFLISPSQATWQAITFAGSTVNVFIPQEESESSPRPRSLMINLHGCAQKAAILRDHGNWEDAATQFNTIVAIPDVPNGGVIAGCWDYYGLNHDRKNRHNGFVIELTRSLVATHNIEAERVFVSGLSSGAGLSMVLGCMAPDLFKGIGLNAGPSVGTSSGQISRAALNVSQVANNCETLAGSNRELISEIKVSVIYGNNDFLVDPEYNRRNAKAFADLLGSTGVESFDPAQFPGSRPQGKGTLYKRSGEAVVSLIENTGLGHNWPAGQGGSPRSFVSKNSLNYPYYLLSFLTGAN